MKWPIRTPKPPIREAVLAILAEHEAHCKECASRRESVTVVVRKPAA